MKRIILLGIVLILCCYCVSKQNKVERIMEDGVEIVLNHIEPYILEGEPSVLTLEEEISIDFARDDIGAMGLANATDFEIDSVGNIYFTYSNKNGDLIFKFDGKGNFIRSFGPKGQGPGEMQFILFSGIDSQDNYIISDHMSKKVLFFTKDGHLIKEIRYPTNGREIFPLENGNYFSFWSRYMEDIQNYQWVAGINNSKFEEIKELDTQDLYDPDTKGLRGVNPVSFFKWKISKGHIFIAAEDRGYEILKYDFDANLVQKIRKEYKAVEVPGDLIKEKKKQFEQYNMKVWFPKYWLPICDFFLDEEGRIYVMTFEKGEAPGEYIFDIFNPDGVFVHRKSLKIYYEGDRMVCARVKRGRLYCFEEKQDKFREFKVYKMRWE